MGSMAAPVLDRVNVLKDPNGHEAIVLKDIISSLGYQTTLIHAIPSTDKAIATFTLSRAQIGSLKSRVVRNQNHLAPPTSTLYLSTFVVASAYAWTCLIKSKEEAEVRDVCCLSFLADCRNRLGYPIPQTYFGNCPSILNAAVERDMLLGGNGMVAAVGAIGTVVKDLGFDGSAVKGADRWIPEWKQRTEECSVVTIAGSPRQRVYETNFGWGKPKKIVMIHIDAAQCFSMLDSRDEEGGVEIGVALSKASVASFIIYIYN